ncbi:MULTISPECIES: hypothetical protein [Microbacterium]|uniref:DUF2550 family protein n=1 Tax=Microbacterium wangchenii TaxID=2541726 RepID=A0ABX5SQV3_9MICO|nr:MULTISPECIES: hypothetical protein [Microbacterium]MCK6066268.1 hypothetical protein [Microbacterium sp. EYE_512]QBR87244.1 hypothetical protein E4K62_00150 [Microbacterium wangchenii]TFV84654.1 hypothetical protein E4V99_06280 [Microbacterium sp. dk485]TXK14564.1 hypothetical protein FVP99_12720 [Microbacterium wangchenii]
MTDDSTPPLQLSRARGKIGTAAFVAAIIVGVSVAGAIVNARLGASPGAVVGWVGLAIPLPAALALMMATSHRGLARQADARGAQVVCLFTRGYAFDASTGREHRIGEGWIQMTNGTPEIRTADGGPPESVTIPGAVTVQREHFLSPLIALPSLTLRSPDGSVIELELARTGFRSLSGPSNKYVDEVAARISAALHQAVP